MWRRIASLFPRGPADFALQVLIWGGFELLYQVARGVADRSTEAAFDNGRWIIDFEVRLHSLVELDLQRFVADHDWLVHALNWTYWLSQFAVVLVALLWSYFFFNDAFYGLRNWLIAANLIGLVGYVLVPTAPPRMFPEEGFVDTLAQSSAAMPSLHGADALIVGLVMASLVRPRWLKVIWLLWPPWVWFAVMATANHYWLDIAAGVGVAALAYLLLTRVRPWELAPPPVLAGRRW
jgi:membrane-associated phospholipid phosphatase